MSETRRHLALLRKIDTICDRYEQELQKGRSPSLDDYLSDADPDSRDELREELLKVTQCYATTDTNVNRGRSEFSDDRSLEFPDQDESCTTATVIEPRAGIRSGQDVKQDREYQSLKAGRYRIEEVIDEGNFGRVLKAWDNQLELWVAIKVRRRGTFPSAVETEDFLAEARRAAQLRHPNIVRVYDVDRFEDGSYYIVSELIDGVSLKQLINDERFEPADVSRIMITLAAAVDHAHQQGIVHRDLKPENILVDKTGKLYVCDFGLALHEDEQLDRKGEISGSPGYMSPEQMEGRANHLDGRSDIWSMGIIFYELLTGKRPFRGKNLEDLKESTLEQEPKPPRMMNPDVPEPLEQITLKCLEKDVRDRFQTAGDLASAVQDWLANQSKPEDAGSEDIAGRYRLLRWVAALFDLL